MEYAKHIKVITCRGQKILWVKQHGSREVVTTVEAVSADGYIFPSFIIEKGKVHHIGWYQNVHAEDAEAYFAVSLKGRIDDELALWWLVDIHNPYSKQRCPGETRLLMLDGHGSHITFRFVDYCEKNNIIIYCLPAHSTHFLQPFDVGLFSQLQHQYSKAVEDYNLTTDITISHYTSFPLFKKVRQEAYTKENIEHAFTACGIVPLHSKVVMEKLQAPGTQACLTDRNHITLERTPHTEHELRQQVSLGLAFAKTAAEGEITGLILRFAHLAEYALTQADIIAHDIT